ncbi:hypothetical protein CK203_114468 [Vitis vinifera]|uniref:Uncharacterized protein n=1 Tax=Vitis vinifera TaxID=29760 RepID=A0A438BP22_VITVI|nr:hypothetical protein CK203_114468 [Vitis vinifera]
MASSLKCLSFYFLVLVLISSTAIQGRPFNGLKKPQSPAGAGSWDSLMGCLLEPSSNQGQALEKETNSPTWFEDLEEESISQVPALVRGTSMLAACTADTLEIHGLSLRCFGEKKACKSRRG